MVQPGRCSVPEPDEAEEAARQEQQRHGSEVAQEVLQGHPPRAGADQQRREHQGRARQRQRARLAPVPGRNRDVPHDGAGQIRVTEQRDFEEETRSEALEVHLLQQLAADGEVAVGRVEDVPVAGGELGQEGQHHVSGEPPQGHARQVAPVDEPVALGEIRGARGDGLEQAAHHRRVHLAVTVDLHDDVRADREGAPEPRLHGARQAEVLGVPQDGHPPPSRLRDGLCDIVVRTVIDDDDLIDEARHAFDDGREVAPDVEARHDDDNAVIAEHRSIPARGVQGGAV